ncbi:MAG: N-acetylneuraminate synthase [Alphaproteobacteria bacterium]|nr:N-acetylneuraminate synthase [Alphaproteobacteria bacterium]
MNLAKKLIDAAAQAGADCVKFQSWTKDTIFSREIYDNDKFLADGRDEERSETLEDVVEKYSLAPAELAELSAYCAEKGIVFTSSVFSTAEADFLIDDLNAPFVKIASMDVTNLPFLAYLGGKGLPVILSTGLSSMSEISAAVDTLTQAGTSDLILLHCVAQYPPEDADTNLRNIGMLRQAFPDALVGFSDHSIGTSIPLAAIGLGACVIEKHFTIDKTMEGWDHAVSANPEELTAIVHEGRRIATALGTDERQVTEKDLEMRTAFRRSIVAARAIKAGEVITRDDLDFKRPGRGISPGLVDTVVGRTARRDIAFDEVLDDTAF